MSCDSNVVRRDGSMDAAVPAHLATLRVLADGARALLHGPRLVYAQGEETLRVARAVLHGGLQESPVELAEVGDHRWWCGLRRATWIDPMRGSTP